MSQSKKIYKHKHGQPWRLSDLVKGSWVSFNTYESNGCSCFKPDCSGECEFDPDVVEPEIGVLYKINRRERFVLLGEMGHIVVAFEDILEVRNASPEVLDIRPSGE